jgi:hypothetical protein
MAKDFYRSLGLETSGAKNDRTALAILDHYPQTGRLILVDIESKIVGVEDLSADEVLISSIKEATEPAPQFTGMGIHGPLTLPPAFRDCLKESGPLPFSNKSNNPEIVWMNELWVRSQPKPRPFCPYLERPIELYMRYMLKERFQVSEALGSNFAPITARLQFLKEHMPGPQHEIFPRATLSRVLASLGLPKTLIRDYSDLEKGVYTRELIFSHLSKKIPQLFLYEKDIEVMVLHMNCFNAFLCALTQHLIFKKQTESPPKNFPKTAGWIHFPKAAIQWSEVFAQD